MKNNNAPSADRFENNPSFAPAPEELECEYVPQPYPAVEGGEDFGDYPY